MGQKSPVPARSQVDYLPGTRRALPFGVHHTTDHAVLISGWVVMLLASPLLVLPLLLISPLRPDQPCLGQLSSHPGPKRKD